MISVAKVVEGILQGDDFALAAARKKLLNLSSYSRAIQPQIQQILLKDIQEGTVTTALSRVVARLSGDSDEPKDFLQGLIVHSNLEGITYERSEMTMEQIQNLYRSVQLNNIFLTVTNGINEITVIAEASAANLFRLALKNTKVIYDKSSLVGITAKIRVGNLEVPNIIYMLTRRLAYKKVNIIEIVSTATELTYIIEKTDLAIALEQLQKDI